MRSTLSVESEACVLKRHCCEAGVNLGCFYTVDLRELSVPTLPSASRRCAVLAVLHERADVEPFTRARQHSGE